MSMPLAILLFWLAMTAAGYFIWRSGDRFGGRGIVLLGAINCALAAGIWLVSVGHPIFGYALQACVACVLLTLLWKADRGLLRALSPGLLLAGAAIAAIVLTQVASSMGAAREVVLGLLVLVGATTVAFLTWMIVSTVRLATISLRRRGN